jgi:hypothetical protein
MISSEIGFFKESVALHIAKPALTETIRRFSGLVSFDVPLIINFDVSTSGKWVIVSCQDGAATVVVSTNVGGDFPPYEVSPGFPLQHFEPTGGGGSLTVTAINSPGAKVEVLVTSSPYLTTEAEPEDLIINPSFAGSVDVDFFAQAITEFRDPRPETLVATPFTRAAGPTATLIGADPDFNGQPSINFAGTVGAPYINLTGDTSWLDGTKDFTFFGVLKIEDEANVSEDRVNVWQNILSLGSGGGGFAFAADSAYRLFVEAGTNSTTAWKGIDLGVEMSSKTSIFIMRYVASTKQIRLYWQGVWRSSYTAVTVPTATNPLNIAGGTQNNAAYRCAFKTAEMRWLNRAATDAEMAAYVATAVSLYALDDTPRLSQPLLTSVLRLFRGNRGNAVGPWRDTRNSIAAPESITLTGTTNQADVHFAESHKSIFFDGIAAFGTSNGNWNELGGGVSPGLTLAMVCWTNAPLVTSQSVALLSQAAYVTAAAGASIWYEYNGSRRLIFQIDNGTGSNSLDQTTTSVPQQIPILVTMEIVTATRAGRVEVTNLLSGSTLSFITASAIVPNAVANVVQFFRFGAAGGYLEGGLAEISTLTRVLTTQERENLKTYARERYGIAA